MCESLWSILFSAIKNRGHSRYSVFGFLLQKNDQMLTNGKIFEAES